MGDRTGGELVVEVLARGGVEVIFGLPSVHNLPIYDAIRRDGRIRAIGVRHEQAAIGAADGFARTTGRLGVCLTSTGPGAANAMAGQLEARVSQSPVLHLTGQIDSRFLGQQRGFIHEVPDQLTMLASASKSAYRPESAAEVPEVVGRAAAQAMTSPCGPVSVEIPIDYQYSLVSSHSRPVAADAAGAFARASLFERPRPAPPDSAGVARAAELIAGSRRPILWAGGGAIAASAGDEVAALARRIGAGIMTSPNGRGIVAEDDPCCIGNLSWDQGVRELCREADLLVAIGTRFQGPNTENWRMELPGHLVHVDVDPGVPGRNYPAEVVIIADAKTATAAILAELDSPERDCAGPQPGWTERVAEVASSARERLRETLGPQVGLLDTLRPRLEASTIVVKDATIPAYTWGNRLLPVSRPRCSIMPNSFAIGLGLPHAIGACVASRGAPVVLLAGDGGFMLSATELATAAQERLALIVILFLDGGYGVLRNIQTRQYGQSAGHIGVDLPAPDFCALAAAFNVACERVGSLAAYARALDTAFSSRGPFLIEVDLEAIGPMATPYTGTSKPPAPSR